MAYIDSATAVAARIEPKDVDEFFECGMFYSAGVGVTIDLIEAHKWFNIAAARGHGEAARLRREVAELMSDSEIGQAQRAARDWLKGHPQQPVPSMQIRAAA
jgi:TPR repeat protein